MKRLILATVLLMGTTFTYGQPPKDEGKAVLTGPKVLQVGQFFKVTSKGSVGADPKLSLTPVIENIETVTLSDGALGLVGEINKPGRYFVVLANNKDGKTFVATLQIDVAGDPGPVPFSLDLQAAYEKDGKPSEKKAYLTALYKKMATESVAKWSDLESLLRKSVGELLKDNELRAVRDEAGKYLLSTLGKLDGPINKDKQKEVFTVLADALQKVE